MSNNEIKEERQGRKHNTSRIKTLKNTTAGIKGDNDN